MKRNANGAGTVRERPDGTWEARCTINGKRRSFYAEKQSDALKKMREALQDSGEGNYAEPNSLTVAQWMDIWLKEYHAPCVKPSSLNSAKSNIKYHINPEFKNVKLQKLQPIQIQIFCNNLKNNLSSSTVRHILANLSSALDQAVKLGYIKSNPVKSCVLPKRIKKEIKPLSEPEIVAFLNQLKNCMYYLTRPQFHNRTYRQQGEPFASIIKVILFTGMRKGEACGLSWDNVDFEKGTITVKQQLCQARGDKKSSYIASTKNGKARVLTPAKFVMDILREVKTEQTRNMLKMGTAWENKFNLVFTYANGEWLSGDTVFRHVRKIAKRIDRPDLRVHNLRHTYAVMALQEGDNPKTVQEALGHSTTSFTLDVYAHVSDKMRKDSSERMQKYYDKLSSLG